MKYLIRALITYPRLVVVGTVMLTSMISIPVSVSALAPVSQTANVITCAGGPTLGDLSTGAKNGKGEKCFVQSYVDPFVKVLAGLVAIFVALSIIIAGIQYSAAADDSSKVSAAKDRIRNALIALLAYLFLLAFVKYLLPGGL